MPFTDKGIEVLQSYLTVKQIAFLVEHQDLHLNSHDDRVCNATASILKFKYSPEQMRAIIVDSIINSIYTQLRREETVEKKSLGDRMKGYENVPRSYLMRRTPVIIRLDGKAFHTYLTRQKRPFSEDVHFLRSKTLAYLVDNIQGCIMGYSQSDEISLVLKDWQTFNTEAWFDNNIQKMASISASMCTAKWNVMRHQLFVDSKLPDMAFFDARVWNVPKEEVVNYLIWRQQDWERNSVQMLASSYYSQKRLQNVNVKSMITMVEEEHGVVWGELDNWKKQGEIYFRGNEGKIEPDFIVKHNRERIETILNGTNEDE